MWRLICKSFKYFAISCENCDIGYFYRKWIMAKIRISVCQHSLSDSIEENYRIIKSQLAGSANLDADIVHFPECNLTGYAGVEFLEYPGNNNSIVEEYLGLIMDMAKELSLWVIIGSYWYREGLTLPYNSLFVINPSGKIECRYDKRLLTAGDSGDDIDYFSPGGEPVTFFINGIKCGLLICHEWRYPELYREYKSLGAELIFQSWYDARVDPEEYRISGSGHGSLIIGSVRSNAANNYLWISGSNASNRESSIGSFLIQPDGSVQSKLPRNKRGLLIAELNTLRRFIDPSRHNRERFL
jgi:predicted amidohydrolase